MRGEKKKQNRTAAYHSTTFVLGHPIMLPKTCSMPNPHPHPSPQDIKCLWSEKFRYTVPSAIMSMGVAISRIKLSTCRLLRSCVQYRGGAPHHAWVARARGVRIRILVRRVRLNLVVWHIKPKRGLLG